MAATITSSATALTRIELMVAYDQEPTLTAAQCQALLDAHVLATVYAATPTQYLPGTCVVPTVLNGRQYMSVANDLVDSNGGTAYTSVGTTEPDWPRGIGYQVEDGNVLWEDVGPAPVCLWDLRAAAYEGWGQKAASLSGSGTVKAGSLSESASEAHAQCLVMQRRFGPVGVL